MSNWTTLGSVTEISPGQFEFSDTQATNQAQRFYLIRSPKHKAKLEVLKFK